MKKIKVGVSARHVHLSKDVLDILFGKDYCLTLRNYLGNNKEYACKETVSVSTKDGVINKVRVLGPLREKTQVEISRSDARILNLNPPVRNSGDLSESCSVKLFGPVGSVELSEGCIIAARHIHLGRSYAEALGVLDGQTVSVLSGGERGGIMNNVFCRVSDDMIFEMHIDTDEANAFMLSSGDLVEILTVNFNMISQ